MTLGFYRKARSGNEHQMLHRMRTTIKIERELPQVRNFGLIVDYKVVRKIFLS